MLSCNVDQLYEGHDFMWQLPAKIAASHILETGLTWIRETFSQRQTCAASCGKPPHAGCLHCPFRNQKDCVPPVAFFSSFPSLSFLTATSSNPCPVSSWWQLAVKWSAVWSVTKKGTKHWIEHLQGAVWGQGVQARKVLNQAQISSVCFSHSPMHDAYQRAISWQGSCTQLAMTNCRFLLASSAQLQSMAHEQCRMVMSI